MFVLSVSLILLPSTFGRCIPFTISFGDQQHDEDRTARRDEQRTDTQKHKDEEDDEKEYDYDPDDYDPPSGPLSTVRIVVDAPENDGASRDVLEIAGWAADTAASEGTGIDEVTLWLYQGDYADVTLIGRAEYGLPRPDLARTL